ncbi:hypothetical protein ACMX1E_01635 [Bartonella bacilliformis]|uniref:hypothetical protein n=1 Tax=Bartonella bacilliformis TaxID=774 RepID=UPI000449B811|nr:hypothetical protein [Bartonella bacilliformis]EYS94124.1 hypothetical protein X470_01157 [Bartonella bacilliformis Peru-18]KEG18235.1 hypothetical protein H709_00157 [Bartonella bacilliformis CUSCO5]
MNFNLILNFWERTHVKPEKCLEDTSKTLSLFAFLSFLSAGKDMDNTVCWEKSQMARPAEKTRSYESAPPPEFVLFLKRKIKNLQKRVSSRKTNSLKRKRAQKQNGLNRSKKLCAKREHSQESQTLLKGSERKNKTGSIEAKSFAQKESILKKDKLS